VSKKNVLVGGIALVGTVVLLFAVRPSPVVVEVAQVVRGSLQVTVDEEGETRVCERFVISAPVSGRMARIEFREGDPIEENQVLTVITPSPLNAREREELLARIAAAEARRKEAEEGVKRAQAEFEQARRDRARAEELVKEGYATQQATERARVAEATKAKEVQAARFNVQSAISEVSQARAGLLALTPLDGKAAPEIPVRSPVPGQVLHIIEKSERVVAAGAPLLTVGDPSRLEIVVDILSTEAVNVQPGMTVMLENWGGGRLLRARVRTVEPSAFTKISALGVEEQRVNIIADFIDPPTSLGDAYRVEARIVIWEGSNVLKAPTSALFRRGQQWTVFVIESGRARFRPVNVGHLNALEAEIIDGLTEHDVVIRHPSNQIYDGARVTVREVLARVSPSTVFVS
jgi:HlyD family secretion protein